MALQTIAELHDRILHIKSLTEQDNDPIRENTQRGLAHARSEGRVGGRRPVDKRLDRMILALLPLLVDLEPVQLRASVDQQD